MSRYFKSFFNIFEIILYLSMIFLVEADIDQKVTDSLKRFDDECGYLPKKEEPVAKIRGGHAPSFDEVPWMVFVEKSEYTPRSRCSGSLIGPRHVLTAAHCFRGYTNEGVEAGLYNVYMGDVDIDVMRDFYKLGCASVNKYKYMVTEVHQHPKYKVANKGPYDLAIVLLDREVIISSTTPVKPICLPKADFNLNLELKIADIMGWGHTRPPKKGVPEEYVARLRKTQVQIWETEECESSWGRFMEYHRICHGNEDHNCCKGDSGGPLIIQKDNRYIQVGVNVIGFCGEYNLPTIAERVTFHLEWIKTTVKDTLRSSYEKEAQNEGYN